MPIIGQYGTLFVNSESQRLANSTTFNNTSTARGEVSTAANKTIGRVIATFVGSTSPFCKSFGAKVGIAQAPKGAVTRMDRVAIALFLKSDRPKLGHFSRANNR